MYPLVKSSFCQRSFKNQFSCKSPESPSCHPLSDLVPQPAPSPTRWLITQTIFSKNAVRLVWEPPSPLALPFRTFPHTDPQLALADVSLVCSHYSGSVSHTARPWHCGSYSLVTALLKSPLRYQVSGNKFLLFFFFWHRVSCSLKLALNSLSSQGYLELLILLPSLLPHVGSPAGLVYE